MINVDVHRAYFHAQAKPHTYVEVPDEDQFWGRQGVWVLGEGVVWNEASGIGVAGRSGEGDAPSKHESRSIFAGVYYYRSDVDRSGRASFTVNDFVIVTRRWNGREIEKHLCSNETWRCRHWARR